MGAALSCTAPIFQLLLKHHVGGGDCNSELAYDLRQIHDQAQRLALIQIQRYHDRVARIDTKRIEAVVAQRRTVLLADDGAAGANDESASVVGIAIRAARETNVGSKALAWVVDEGVLVVDRSVDADRGRHLGNDKPVTILQRQIGKLRHLAAVGLQLQHDAARSPGLTKAVDHILVLRLGGSQRRTVLRADRAVCAADGGRADLKRDLIDILVQALLLHTACRLAGKLRSIQISL